MTTHKSNGAHPGHNGRGVGVPEADGPVVLNAALRESLGYEYAELVRNEMSARRDWLRKLFDPRRSIDDECGYPRTDPSTEEYARLYDREPVAARVVEVLAKESWQVQPEVYEDEDETNVTPFEQAWDDLGKTLAANGGASWHQDEEGSPVWEHLTRADILSGIGAFGILLLGLDDGLDLSVPAPGALEEPAADDAEKVGAETTGDMPDGKGGGKRGLPKSKSKPFRVRNRADSPVTNAELVKLRALPNLTELETEVIDRLEHEAHVRNRTMKEAAEPDPARTRAGQLSSTDAQYDGLGMGGAFGGAGEVPSTKAGKKGAKLLFLRAFDESLVQIVRFESDIRSPRFGQPVMYRVTLNDPDTGRGGIGLPQSTVMVHWSRVIHVADTGHQAKPSEIFAAPRMKPVYNRLLDIRKVSGTAGESYFRAGVPALTIRNAVPGDSPTVAGTGGVTGMKQTIENFQNGFQRTLLLDNLIAEPLVFSPSDPAPFLDALVNQVCIKLGCPVRVFMGSERGELASSQDDASWNDRLNQRRHGYITPRIIVPFIDRLILLGVLPEPDFVPEPEEDPEAADLDLPPSEADQKTAETGVDAAKVSADAQASGAPNKPKGKPPAFNAGDGTYTANFKTWYDRDGKVVATNGIFNAAPPPLTPAADKAVDETEADDYDPAAEMKTAEEAIQSKKLKNADDAADVRPVGYRIAWPDLDSNTEKEKAEIANTRVTALAAYVSGGLEALIPPLDFLTKVMQFDALEAKEMLAAAQAAEAKKKEADAALAEQHGLVPQIEGFKDPNAPPPVIGAPGDAAVPEDDGWGTNRPPAMNSLDDDPDYDPAHNQFCPTGEGGGVDPTCGKDGGTDSSDDTDPVDRAVNAAKKAYPKAGDTVDGRAVIRKVDNQDSIDAELTDSERLPGLREVRMDAFQSVREGKAERRPSADDERKVASLVEKITAGKKISGLIVVDDGHPDGPYVLEGGHRFDALHRMGATSFPALVVIDAEAVRDRARAGTLAPRLGGTTANQFCATGEGGGVDPTCPSGDGSGASGGSGGKGGSGKTPNAAQLEKANEGKRLHPNVSVKKDADGNEWVVKGRAGKGAGVQNEATAAALAKTAGVDVVQVHPQKHNGQDVAVSERVAGTALSAMSPADRRAAMAKVPKAEVDRQALFDYAIGSTDPNMGNYIIRPNGSMVAIDKEQSLGYGTGKPANSSYHPPAFLEASVQQGKAAVHYEFDRRNLTDMASAANRMADDLAAQGKKKEADGVRRRAEVMTRVAAGTAAPTAAELDRVGREYDRTNPAAKGIGGFLRGLVGNEAGVVENADADDWPALLAESLLAVLGDGWDDELLPDADEPTANYDPSQPRDGKGRFAPTGSADSGRMARTLLDVHAVTGLNQLGTTRLVEELTKMSVADLRVLSRERGWGTVKGRLKADKVQHLSEVIAAKYGGPKVNPNAPAKIEHAGGTKVTTKDTPVELPRRPAQTDIWRGWAEAKDRSPAVAKQFLNDVATVAGSRELRSLAMDNGVPIGVNPGGKGTDLAHDGEIIRRILAKSHPEPVTRTEPPKKQPPPALDFSTDAMNPEGTETRDYTRRRRQEREDRPVRPLPSTEPPRNPPNPTNGPGA